MEERDFAPIVFAPSSNDVQLLKSHQTANLYNLELPVVLPAAEEVPDSAAVPDLDDAIAHAITAAFRTCNSTPFRSPASGGLSATTQHRQQQQQHLALMRFHETHTPTSVTTQLLQQQQQQQQQHLALMRFHETQLDGSVPSSPGMSAWPSPMVFIGASGEPQRLHIRRDREHGPQGTASPTSSLASILASSTLGRTPVQPAQFRSSQTPVQQIEMMKGYGQAPGFEADTHTYSAGVVQLASPNTGAPGIRRRRSKKRAPIPDTWDESLLTMSTKELNLHLKGQNIPAKMVAEIKTCRRRIKNREYTRQSRSRKAAAIGTNLPTMPGTEGALKQEQAAY